MPGRDDDQRKRPARKGRAGLGDAGGVSGPAYGGPAYQFGATDASGGLALSHAAAFIRLASFAMVALLQPVAACMLLQDWPAVIMRLMPALRSTSSARPL
jgi:hypothetical protein